MLNALVSTFAACAQSGFFNIPTWYKYLPLVADKYGNCRPNISLNTGGALDLTALLLIGLGIFDIVLRVASLVAVGFIMYAGVQYVTAQGEPDKAKHALNTIINALIGLGITIVSAATVSFIGNRIGG